MDRLQQAAQVEEALPRFAQCCDAANLGRQGHREIRLQLDRRSRERGVTFPEERRGRRHGL